MAISYNTGTTASASTAASCAVTIPAGVLTGDVMLLGITVFTETSSAPSVGFSGGGGTWTLVPVSAGTNPNVSAAGGIWSYGYVYYRIATAGDPGATLTITETGSAAGTTWFDVSLASYTGVVTSPSPIDVAASTALTGQTATTITSPSVTTTDANDWWVQLYLAGTGASATLTGPGTKRQSNCSSAGVSSALYDSNSAFAAGTAVGSGTLGTAINASNSWPVAFTIALNGGAPVAPLAPLPPNLLMYPLWEQLLEVAAYRRDIAPAVATPAPFTWRLMDGVNGRPGVASAGTQPPASGTSNVSAQVNGLSWYVTQGGMWFQGYWYYCCASGQSTAPARFALWSDFSGGGSVVPGSVVTSGTLTAGAWNWVPLPVPVPIAIGGQYTAAVGVPANAGYPDSTGQFGSGQPYGAGITSGPLAAFSDTAGTNPAPYSYGQGATASGSDPSVTHPVSGSGSHDNYWLDVQVTNVPPAGYGGSYRLWPNMADADFNTAIDSAVNYVVGTEIIVSQPCYVNAIWYYLPAGTAQFATSADIWRVRDGVRVATQPAPTWRQASGAKATFTSGQGGSSAQWAWCDLPGPVYLAPGDYRVSVYNGAGTPDGWSAKRLGYWEAVTAAAGGGGTPDGTYQHSPPGAAGITNGPLYAPPTPLASPATDYSTGNAEPGQSVFAVGPPNQFPNIYVGQSSAGIYTGPALFQNYWVDLEVTPAALYTPDAPDLPQRVFSPYWEQFLEVAASRVENGTPQPGAPVTAPAGLAAGTGTAGQPAVTITVQAGLATAAGSALAPVPVVTPSAGLAAGTGTAGQPGVTVSPSAGLAAGTGAALGPVPGITAPAGLATAAGTALGPVPQVTATPGLAAGSGTAGQPGIALTVNAGLASAAGNALAPVPQVTVLAGLATAAGAALQPAVSGAGTASAGLAVGTGTALGPVPGITVQAGLASAAGTALGPAAGIAAAAGQASAAAQALAPLVTVRTLAGLAAAAGNALQPSVPLPGDVTAHAGLATAAAVALQAAGTPHEPGLWSTGSARLPWTAGAARLTWTAGRARND